MWQSPNPVQDSMFLIKVTDFVVTRDLASKNYYFCTISCTLLPKTSNYKTVTERMRYLKTSTFFIQVFLTHLNYKVQYGMSFSVLNYKVQYGVSFSVLNNWITWITHTYFPLSTFTCSIHWTINIEHENNIVQQKVLSEEQSYSVICPCSKSISTEVFFPQSVPPSLIGWVSFHSHTFGLWQLVLPSASVFFSIFFFPASSRLTSSHLHLGFLFAYCPSEEWEVSCRERFNLTYFFLRGDEMSHSWPCCPPLSPKNQDNKLDILN